MSKTTTDPIADMLSRIRNAVMVRKSELSVPHSKVKQSVAELLKQAKFIEDVKVVELGIGKTLSITLNNSSSNAHITEIVRVSKPGRRQYAAAEAIPVVKRGRGIVIVSTSKGLMTGADAKRHKIGGELICKVY